MYNEISLVILDAYTQDIGIGVARVGSEVMKSIGTSDGDVIELIGHRRTVSKLLQLYPPDEKKGMIRIDGMIRNNVGANIGDHITIKKILAQRAEKVIVTPLEAIPPVDERYLADALHTIPVISGDNITVPYFGGHLTFQVVGTMPDSVVVIDQKTIFAITTQIQGLQPVETTHTFLQYVYSGTDPATPIFFVLEWNNDEKPVEIHYRNCKDFEELVNSLGQNQNLITVYSVVNGTLDEAVKYAEKTIAQKKHSKGWKKSDCCLLDED